MNFLLNLKDRIDPVFCSRCKNVLKINFPQSISLKNIIMVTSILWFPVFVYIFHHNFPSTSCHFVCGTFLLHLFLSPRSDKLVLQSLLKSGGFDNTYLPPSQALFQSDSESRGGGKSKGFLKLVVDHIDKITLVPGM